MFSECAGQEQDTGSLSQQNSLEHSGLSQSQVSSAALNDQRANSLVHRQGN